VRVAGVPGVTDVRLKLHVGALAGMGETKQVRATGLLNPLSALTVMVELVEPPGFTEPGFNGEAAILKS